MAATKDQELANRSMLLIKEKACLSIDIGGVNVGIVVDIGIDTGVDVGVGIVVDVGERKLSGPNSFKPTLA